MKYTKEKAQEILDALFELRRIKDKFKVSFELSRFSLGNNAKIYAQGDADELHEFYLVAKTHSSYLLVKNIKTRKKNTFRITKSIEK